jgi:hypothetical protein
LIRAWVCVLSLTLSAYGCGKEEQPAAETRSSSGTKAGGTQATPPTVDADGCVLSELWSHCLVKKRLENAGVAPQPLDSLTVDGLAVRAQRWQVGRAELAVFIYSSAAALEGDLVKFDTSRSQLREGSRVDWPGRPQTIVSRNLLAVLSGGSERQQERVRDVITAGLPALQPR